ncbi:(Na+)-NQR maturation NqrM [Ferrimonas lipolytica]|uniref:(Na+)-NQR maturation NqrM n=1 Tax=Ferrimonas lipolytica TaxID=2724191 RepID=A0A6H1UAJ6_9GAMM|nr:(Na+)-NQR maturation NqrM [Ferrimonas lipolytica]QIZ76071.1 (Na+)-NQR maturation NqrM [Ferrimonas lipolytica]
MIQFIATFTVFLFVIAAMSIGYIIKRKSIGGSCGGLGSIGIDKACDCPEPCDKRKKKMADEARAAKLNQQRII